MANPYPYLPGADNPQQAVDRFEWFLGNHGDSVSSDPIDQGAFDIFNLAKSILQRRVTAEDFGAAYAAAKTGTAAEFLSAKRAAELAANQTSSGPVASATTGLLNPDNAPPAIVVPGAANANSNSLFGNLFTPGASKDGTPGIAPAYYLIGGVLAFYLYKRFVK